VATGRETPIAAARETRPGDVPWYVSDCARLQGLCGWQPSRTPAQIVADVDAWVGANETELRRVLA
jgi:UDP-glucose 4-epimerase